MFSEDEYTGQSKIKLYCAECGKKSKHKTRYDATLRATVWACLHCGTETEECFSKPYDPSDLTQSAP